MPRFSSEFEVSEDRRLSVPCRVPSMAVMCDQVGTEVTEGAEAPVGPFVSGYVGSASGASRAIEATSRVMP